MRKILFSVIAFALAVFVSANFTLAQKDKNKDHEYGGKPMMVELSGAMEVPGPGDPDGTGMVTIRLNHGQGQVCYDISVKDIQMPTAAHIHAGATGQSGEVKVPLKASADGTWKGCVSADKELIKDLMENPANYYVNVHTADFPNGAVRGQLKK